MNPTDLCLPLGIYDNAMERIIDLTIFRNPIPDIMIRDITISLPVNLLNKPLTV